MHSESCYLLYYLYSHQLTHHMPEWQVRVTGATKTAQRTKVTQEPRVRLQTSLGFCLYRLELGGAIKWEAIEGLEHRQPEDSHSPST